MSLRGSVVDAEGAPVADALVQVITPHLPHTPRYVIAEARSGVDGSFTFRRIRSGAVDEIVVRGNGGSYTFDRRLDRTARGRVSIGRFVVAPTREVSFHVHCDRALSPSPGHPGLGEISVRVFQRPSGPTLKLPGPFP